MPDMTVFEDSFLSPFWKIQGRSPWIDSSCAVCPGFLVPGAASAPAPSFFQEPQIVPRTSICFLAPLDICLDLLPTAHLPPVPKLDSQHKLLQHRSGSSERGRCWLGQSEIPRCSSKLQLFALLPREGGETRRKKVEKQRETKRKKNSEEQPLKKGRLPALFKNLPKQKCAHQKILQKPGGSKGKLMYRINLVSMSGESYCKVVLA